MKKRIGRLVLIFFLMPLLFAGRGMAAPPSGGDSDEDVLVGRISHVEGELLRYIPEEKDWVATTKDAPFGLDDTLYSGEKSRAEIIMPNSTIVRIDEDTQIQMIALKGDVTEVDVASGVARLYNNDSRGVIKATTPFGYVIAREGSVFDLYVGDESAEVIALKGRVDFIHEGDDARYEVKPGSSSVIADSRNVSSGDGTVDRDWDGWNENRDRDRIRRIEVKGDSARYLPQGLRDDAYDLDDNGRWERVYYDGGYHQMWRPTRVAVGWTPYSVGRWTDYYGDQCWVPAEPFGYVTHHYGNWVYADRGWYWAPPAARVGVAVAPGLGISFSWFPGRVGWIHTGVNVGWVPLAPREVYYGYRHWGPRTVIINRGGFGAVNVSINNYRYIDRAVVVRHHDFYNVRDYRNVRIANIDRTTIIRDYRPAPVVNNTVINNYTINRNRYNIDNVTINRKPHQSVVDRIQRNQRIATESRNVNAAQIERNADRGRVRNAERLDSVPQPRMSRRLVGTDAVNKPVSEVKFDQKELKRERRAPVDGRQMQDTGGARGRRGDNEGAPATGAGSVQQGENQDGRKKMDRERPVSPRRTRELQGDTGTSGDGPQGVQDSGAQRKSLRDRRSRENLQGQEGGAPPADDQTTGKRQRAPRDRTNIRQEGAQGAPSDEGGQGSATPPQRRKKDAVRDEVQGSGQPSDDGAGRTRERPARRFQGQDSQGTGRDNTLQQQDSGERAPRGNRQRKQELQQNDPGEQGAQGTQYNRRERLRNPGAEQQQNTGEQAPRGRQRRQDWQQNNPADQEFQSSNNSRRERGRNSNVEQQGSQEEAPKWKQRRQEMQQAGRAEPRAQETNAGRRERQGNRNVNQQQDGQEQLPRWRQQYQESQRQ